MAAPDESHLPRTGSIWHDSPGVTASTLCLRAGVLDAIRHFNGGRKANELIHVHLVDIDLNAEAIRGHLLTLKTQIPTAGAVSVPAAVGIKAHGLEVSARLQRLTNNPEILGELRTVAHSIRAYRQGLDGNAGSVKGSPYLDDRQNAIVSNIVDMVNNQHGRPVLALYGNDHVSNTLLHNGGPRRDTYFPPAALRLNRAGMKVFSVVTIPLTGSSSWRGHEKELMWSASDGSLSSGETLDVVLASSPASTLLYIDPPEPAKGVRGKLRRMLGSRIEL